MRLRINSDLFTRKWCNILTCLCIGISIVGFWSIAVSGSVSVRARDLKKSDYRKAYYEVSDHHECDRGGLGGRGAEWGLCDECGGHMVVILGVCGYCQVFAVIMFGGLLLYLIDDGAHDDTREG